MATPIDPLAQQSNHRIRMAAHRRRNDDGRFRARPVRDDPPARAGNTGGHGGRSIGPGDREFTRSVGGLVASLVIDVQTPRS